jgi:hypothetical protein
MLSADLQALVHYCRLVANGDSLDYYSKANYFKKNPLGLTLLGNGASRVVFDLGNGTVIKISYNDFNYSFQNKGEWERWRKSQDSDLKKHLCPIIDHDVENHTWSIMPKAERVGSLDHDEESQIGAALEQLGIDSSDSYGYNCGFYNGHPVALDYGYA